jgi:uncharacterized protein YjdB
MQIMKITAKRRTLALFVAVIMALSLWTALPLTASADTPNDAGVYTTTGFTYKLVESEDPESGDTITTAAITGYTGEETDIAIPDFVAGSGETANIPVTKIQYNSFKDNTVLTSVDIPDTVTTIEFGVFNGCTGLSSVTIPDSVTYLGAGVFQYCSNLIEVKLPKYLTSIEDYLFYSCEKLASIEIPEGVTIIRSKAFFSCKTLTSVAIPDKVMSIDLEAFRNCTNLTSVKIPEGVETIANQTFDGCTNLSSIAIPSGVTNIGNMAFNACTNITTVTVPSFVLGSGEGGDIGTVFSASKDKITTVIVADGVTEIPADAFTDLTALETIVLPDSVTSIAAGAFPNVNTLKEITIPDDVTIDEGVLPGDLGDLKIWCYNGSDAQTAAGKNAVIMISAITLNKTALSLNINGKQTLSATYFPENHNETNTDAPDPVVWSSSDSTVATVDADSGEVTAVSYGSAVITATAATHSGVKTAECNLTVAPPPPTHYTVTVENGTGGGSFVAGATVTITANAASEGKVFDTWTTNDGVTFTDPTSASITFTMPAKAVTVTATYKDDPASGGDDPNPPVEPPAVNNGWVYANGAWKYFIDGVAQTGWIYDDGAWYYLDADGIMQTGWIYDSNYKAWYYLAGNGAMKTGWVKDDGNWYYLAGNGAMVANKWLEDSDGSWYYLSGNGKMLTGKQTIGGKTYTFKSNGFWVS